MVRGSYAEYAAVPADRLVPVPDDVPLEAAAAVMLQGTTAHYLTRSTFPLDATHTCLVQAAAEPPEEMARLFARYPEALARTIEIAERCRFSLDELAYQYPEERRCPA